MYAGPCYCRPYRRSDGPSTASEGVVSSVDVYHALAKFLYLLYFQEPCLVSGAGLPTSRAEACPILCFHIDMQILAPVSTCPLFIDSFLGLLNWEVLETVSVADWEPQNGMYVD